MLSGFSRYFEEGEAILKGRFPSLFNYTGPISWCCCKGEYAQINKPPTAERSLLMMSRELWWWAVEGILT